jgi:Family of unknown function (DUF5313)
MIEGGVRRPNPARWVAYAFGAGLPAAHREWVLHDTTARTWQLRHLARTAVQLAPFAIALYVFIPGEPWVRGMSVLAGLALGFFYSAAYMYETVEHRAVKAGYPRGTAAATRAAAHADENRERAERYERQWRNPR